MAYYKIVNSEVSSLYKKNNYSSEIISQALIWERVEIIGIKDNWCKIKQWDNYESWIYKDCLSSDEVYAKNNLSNYSKWFYVNKRISEIISEDKKNKKYLSFGSLIPIIDIKDEVFLITIMPDNNKYYINVDNVVSSEDNIDLDRIINYSMQIIGTPYLWGGKSGFGYDCSGFIQTLFRFLKVALPRDCKDQISCSNLQKVSKDIQKGDLIYFNNNDNVSHVGMLINSSNFIHCSGEVKIESTNKDDVNFNLDLYNKIHSYYRIV